MATAPTATARKVENPRIPTALNLTPLSTKDASSTEPTPVQAGGNAESNDTLPLAKTRNADEDGLVSDTQKKMKRAERFGMPMHLTEKEKRNSRADRFGTGSAVSGLDSVKQSEELKKKARAERFGALQSTASDEDAKKKARLARFGSFPTDSAEEDKKKARALRFSQPDCSSKVNGDDNIKKKAIAGKAGGGT